MKQEKRRPIRGILIGIGAAVVAGTLFASCAGTPPITDAEGDSIPGSIATRELVQVNDKEQGIVVRGRDREAPVVLWLAGGPGGSEIGWTRDYLAELEEDVVMVNWDQPGVGLSYGATDWDRVTVEDFVTDTIAMSEYLADRFHKERIILVGHSWGSIIGLMAADRRPDLYSAYVGVAQQVNNRENDLYGYEMVLERATDSGKRDVVKRLTEMGPPPYSREEGKNYLYLFQKVHVYSRHPAPEPSFGAMLFPKEYNLRNSINLIRGLLKGVSNVYPQLADLDFEKQIPSVELPVYFFTGRYDETCVQYIARRYYENLDAPHKEFVWFENSGHNLPYHEPERFVREFRERVLKQPRITGAN